MLGGLFRGSVKSREMRETRELHGRVSELFRSSRLGRIGKTRYAQTLLEAAFDDVPDEIARRLTPVARTIIEVLIEQEGFFSIPSLPDHAAFGVEEGARLRELLRCKERLYSNPGIIDEWDAIVTGILS